MPAGWCRATLDATPATTATTADCPQVGSRKPILNHQTRQKVEPRVTTDAVLNCLHSTCREMKKMSVNVAGNKPLPCRKTLCPAETYSRKVFSRCAERRIITYVPHISITISANMFRWWDVAVFLRERSGLWPTLTRIFFIFRHVE